MDAPESVSSGETPGARGRWRRVLALTAVAVAASVAVVGSANANWTPPTWRVSQSAVAIPSPGAAHAYDAAWRYIVTGGRKVRANSVASSSLDCDGCTATSMALQVVYANDVLELTADNVATAWASCAGCTGTAVAVQVVVARSAKVLLPGNHALALNVGCVGCHTTALAMQFVLVTPSPRALSADARAEIEAVLTGIPSSVLRPVASARVAAAGKQAGTPLDRVAMTLQTIAAHDLGATSSSHTVQMRVG